MRVLIADDDPEVIRVLSIYLQAVGFSVRVASDAVQTWMFAKQQPLSAVLLDVHLPGGHGLEILRKMKANAQTKGIPILMMSGDADDNLSKESIQLGATDFLPKPLNLDRLLASLRSSLRLTGPGQLARSEGSTQEEASATPLPTRILIAEDDVLHRRILEKFLPQWSFQVEVACDGESALRALTSENAPQMALLDWMMPGLDGPAICRRIRAEIGRPYAYLILLTAKDQKEDLLEGLEAGADDYLIKPFDSQELHARLRAGSRILKLQQDLLSAQKDLRHQATHDPLTQTPNRRHILDFLAKELHLGSREESPTAVILADIDHFKNLNDTRGHLAGDAALREVAARLGETIRPYDSVGRYGGEEFLIVAHNCEAESAVNLAERLRRTVGESPVELPDGEAQVTLSLGIAVSPGLDLVPVESLVAAADAALYEAKRRGRNRVEISPLTSDNRGERSPPPVNRAVGTAHN